MHSIPTLLLVLISLSAFVLSDVPHITYANTFFDPTSIVEKKYNSSTAAAQSSIIQWADELAAEGPWGRLSFAWFLEATYLKQAECSRHE